MSVKKFFGQKQILGPKKSLSKNRLNLLWTNVTWTNVALTNVTLTLGIYTIYFQQVGTPGWVPLSVKFVESRTVQFRVKSSCWPALGVDGGLPLLLSGLDVRYKLQIEGYIGSSRLNLARTTNLDYQQRIVYTTIDVNFVYFYTSLVLTIVKM